MKLKHMKAILALLDGLAIGLFIVDQLGYGFIEMTFTNVTSILFTSALLYFSFATYQLNRLQSRYYFDMNRPMLVAKRYSRDIFRVTNHGKVTALKINWTVHLQAENKPLLQQGEEDFLLPNDFFEITSDSFELEDKCRFSATFYDKDSFRIMIDDSNLVDEY